MNEREFVEILRACSSEEVNRFSEVLGILERIAVAEQAGFQTLELIVKPGGRLPTEEELAGGEAAIE